MLAVNILDHRDIRAHEEKENDRKHLNNHRFWVTCSYR